MDKLKKIFLSLSHQERTVFLAASFLLVVGLIVSGSVIVGTVTKAIPASGGDYSEGFAGQPAFINPVLATNDADRSIIRLVFSRLSDMATKIEGSGDGKTWKVRLQEGILWSDDEKLTSDDVIFTVQRIQDPDSKSPLAPNWQNVAATRKSELELEFSLATPYSFFKSNLENLYILPQHLFKNTPSANWKISDYNLKPVGSGPYKFVEYEKRNDGFITSYHLQSNEKYFADKPLINNFYFRFFPDAESLIKSFNSGGVDGIANLPFGSLGEIKRTYSLIDFRMPSYYAVFMNQSRNSLLKETAVRKALALASPKQRMLQEIFGGKAQIDNGPIPPDALYFDPAVHGGEDVELARKTLDDAGWKVVGESTSSARTKTIGKNNTPLEINLTVPQIPFLAQTAKLLQESWQSIGFRVNLVSLPPEEILEGAIKNRDYEMLLFGNVLNANSDLFSFWHSSERFYPGLNLSLYSNKKADQLIEKIRKSLSLSDLTETFNQLQEMIAADYPAIFLYSPDYTYIANKNLKGIETKLIAEPADHLKEVAKWHLKTARVLK